MADIIKTQLHPEGDSQTILHPETDVEQVQGLDEKIKEISQGETGKTPNVTARASVDNSVGTPRVEVEREGDDENPVFRFKFFNLKGADGKEGETGPTGDVGPAPNIQIVARIGTDSTNEPNVSVVKTGTDKSPIFNMRFNNIVGPQGEPGPEGTHLVNISIQPSTEEENVYEIFYELSDSKKPQYAGSFTAPNGRGIKDVELSPASVSEQGSTYNLEVTYDDGSPVHNAGDIFVPNGKEGAQGPAGPTGANGVPVYSAIGATPMTDMGITDYPIAKSDIFPQTPEPVVGATVVFATDANTYIGTVKQVQSAAILVTAQKNLNAEGGSGNSDIVYWEFSDDDVNTETFTSLDPVIFLLNSQGEEKLNNYVNAEYSNNVWKHNIYVIELIFTETSRLTTFILTPGLLINVVGTENPNIIGLSGVASFFFPFIEGLCVAQVLKTLSDTSQLVVIRNISPAIPPINSKDFGSVLSIDNSGDIMWGLNPGLYICYITINYSNSSASTNSYKDLHLRATAITRYPIEDGEYGIQLLSNVFGVEGISVPATGFCTITGKSDVYRVVGLYIDIGHNTRIEYVDTTSEETMITTAYYSTPVPIVQLKVLKLL